MSSTPPIHTSNVNPGIGDQFLGLRQLGPSAYETVRSTADEVAQRLLAEGPLRDAIDRIDTGSLNANVTRRSAPFSLNAEIILDLGGLIDGTIAAYIPHRYYFGTAETGAILDGTVAQSGSLPNRVKVSLAATSALQSVYFDAVDLAFKVATYPQLMPTNLNRYFHVLTLHGADVISDIRWTPTKADAALATGALRGLVYDRTQSKLRIPPMFGVQGSGVGWQLQPVDADTYYREFVVADLTGSHTQVYLDIADLVANGWTSPTAVHITAGLSGSPRISDRASHFVKLGEINSQMFVPAPGVAVAKIVENQFGCGKDDTDLSERTTAGCVVDNLAEAEALALGFTRGWRNPVSGSAFVGGLFPAARNSGVVFAKWYLEAAADGQFGTPSGRLFQRNADGSTSFVTATATMMKQIGPRVRQYMAHTRLATGATFEGAWYGATGGVDAVKVFGVQFYAGAEGEPFISDADYPRAQDVLSRRLGALEALRPSTLSAFQPLLPPKLHFVEGRPYSIYPDQAFGFNARSRYRLAVATHRGTRPPVMIEASSPSIEIPTDRVGTVVEFMFQDLTQNGGLQTRIATAAKVMTLEQVASLNLRILCIGDSLTDHTGTSVQTIQRLRDMGATVACIGTTTMTSEAPEDAGVSEPGEGRSSRQFGQYIYKVTSGTAPVAVGGEAAYLALSNTEKFGYNPFIRVADDGDEPTKVFNGHVFDFRFYLDRFGFADPDVVLINLGTNDFAYQDYPAAITNILDGARVMAEQIRAAVSSTKIMIVVNASARTTGEIRWNTGHRPALVGLLKLLHDMNDDNVFLVPAYLGVSRDGGFKFSGTLNVETGENIGMVSDTVHYAPFGLAQFGELTAQMIAGAVG